MRAFEHFIGKLGSKLRVLRVEWVLGLKGHGTGDVQLQLGSIGQDDAHLLAMLVLKAQHVFVPSLVKQVLIVGTLDSDNRIFTLFSELVKLHDVFYGAGFVFIYLLYDGILVSIGKGVIINNAWFLLCLFMLDYELHYLPSV